MEDHYYEATLTGAIISHKDVTEATSISPVVSEDASSPFYDLTGRKVNKPLPGHIYIKNNKKITY